jgi:hypothetical protein
MEEEERPELVVELADGVLDRDTGAVLLPDVELDLNTLCDLVVRGGAGEARLPARVVFADPARGTGLEVVGYGAELRERVSAIDREPDAEPEATPESEPEGANEREPLALNPYQRLRGLTLAEQVKRAHSVDMSERIALERMYGKNVWEPLLRNPRLTAPEVARIARMGLLPRTLLEVIVGNGTWLQVPEVRRALLANPKLSPDQIMRVLRHVPKHELKLAAVQTAYPHAVRDAAKRLLRDTM